MRVDLYLKVELDLENDEDPNKVADEICRQILKVYGVRSAETTNYVTSE